MTVEPATTDHRFAPCDATLRDGRVITLRSAEPEDAAALLSYIRSSLPDNTPYVLTHPEEFDMDDPAERAWIQRHLDKPGSLAMLACAGDRVVGVVACTTRPDRQRIAHVGGLGMSVAKAYWGSGLGTAMMAALIDWAEAHPVLGYLELDVYSDNERAVRLYRGQGFVETGTQHRRTRFEDGSCRDGLLMFRRVDGTLTASAQPGDFCESVGEGVVLRQVRYGDAERLYDIYQRNADRYKQYFRWAWRIHSAGSFRGSIARWREVLENDGVVTCVIEEGDALHGMAYMVSHQADDKRMDLGYWLDEASVGRGLVTQSCRALIRHGFESLKVNRIDIFAEPANARSRAVAERLGFSFEAEIAQFMGFPDGRCEDLVNYRLLRTDWEA